MLTFGDCADLLIDALNQFTRVKQLLRDALPCYPGHLRPWDWCELCDLFHRADFACHVLQSRPLHATELLHLLARADQLVAQTQDLVKRL
jgi:hypothetical protein